MKYSTSLLALAAGVLSLVTSACGEDSEPADPVAELRFFHASSTLGTLDIAVEDSLIQVTPDALSTGLEVPPGTTTIEISNSGAGQPILSFTDALTEGQHIYVIAGDAADSSLQAFEVGEQPPVLLDGSAAYQLVSVVGADLTVDVHGPAGSEVQSVTRYSQSGFFIAEPENATLAVYNEGDDPASSVPLVILDSSELGLRAGGVSTILLKGDLTGLEVIVTSLQ
ncbi:MAG: hypothetical protein ACJAYU_002923 [Bradymonadia bacterium]|jgi:hypothetical protein